MTEAEWLSGKNPEAIIDYLQWHGSRRKRRHFACACCRRVWNSFTDDRSRRAVEVAEQYADYPIAAELLTATEEAASRRAYFEFGERGIEEAAPLLLKRDVDISTVARLTRHGREQQNEQKREQAVIIADLLGNPFRPVAIDPDWLTSTVVSLARGMYESRDFSTMPILADALQDAGCENEDILNHCRSTGPHVRGCWVVDLLLGKE